MNIKYVDKFEAQAGELREFLVESGFAADAELDKIVQAMRNSHIIAAIDEDTKKLAALINVLADGSYASYVQFMVVAPAYRGKGINDELIKMVMKAYQAYSKIINLAADEFHAGFFTKLGFTKSNEVVVKH